MFNQIAVRTALNWEPFPILLLAVSPLSSHLLALPTPCHFLKHLIAANACSALSKYQIPPPALYGIISPNPHDQPNEERALFSVPFYT